VAPAAPALVATIKRVSLPIVVPPAAVAPVTSVGAATTAIDPVCHMTVTIATARHVGSWDGRTWYFCNPRCKDKFLAEPARYLEPHGAAK
jgi:YHS domain-containing protein